MKYKLLLITAIAAAGLAVSRAFDVPTQSLRSTAPVSQDLLVTNVNNTTGLEIQKGPTNTASFIKLKQGGTTVFELGTNGFVPLIYGGTGTNTAAGAKSNLGIQAGTVISTNAFLMTNTFSPVFSSTPYVTVSGPSNCLAHVVSVNPTNVVIGVAGTNSTVRWIAIGAP